MSMLYWPVDDADIERRVLERFVLPAFADRATSRISTSTMTSNVTPRRPANGKQVRADRTRAMVIDETVRCVLEEGFGAASAKHITERAGVTWGVIQYHFGDRDGLLMAVVDSGFSELLAKLREVEPKLSSQIGRARTELLVNTVAEAFLSPTSIAALEILIATRAEPRRRRPTPSA